MARSLMRVAACRGELRPFLRFLDSQKVRHLRLQIALVEGGGDLGNQFGQRRFNDFPLLIRGNSQGLGLFSRIKERKPAPV